MFLIKVIATLWILGFIFVIVRDPCWSFFKKLILTIIVLVLGVLITAAVLTLFYRSI